MVHRRMTDVPDSKVDNIVKGFEVGKCKNIKKTKQANDLWTVDADCPDITPANTADGDGNGPVPPDS